MKEIVLGKWGKNAGKHKAIVDDADYEWLIQSKWSAVRYKNTWYVKRNAVLPNRKHTTEYIHRVILGLSPEDHCDVDHLNHNGLDNRRANIHAVTHQQNLFNWPQAKGVSWRSDRQKYRAYITLNQRQIFLGYFTLLEEAQAARAAAKEKYHKIAS